MTEASHAPPHPARPPGAPRPPRPARTVPVDPRMRQRLIDVRRAEGRRRLRVLIAVSCALAALAGAAGIVYSPLLAVRHTRVTGTARVPVATVLGVAGLSHRRLMVDIDPARVEQRLAQVPWVGTAHVRRQWPATVTITIEERTSVAAVAAAGG
ncbi:MAG: cell division protein FtsQ/DivIB, partial [Acidimicrobiales bacterium]